MNSSKNKKKTWEIEKEIKEIKSYPDDLYLEIIRDVGFECDLCGKCCTSEFNDHVFLLDEDARKIIENIGREFVHPAPYYDFCDNLGRFYVMGYALRTNSSGNCIFYANARCEHYDMRPLVCKIYPYMLHMEADEDGNIEWRQIAGLNEHGLYHSEIDENILNQLLMDVKNYESLFLDQKLAFDRTIKEHFRKNDLKHSQQMYDKKMREIMKGKDVEIYVSFKGELKKEIISKHVINPG
ncbi:MAG: YkgJ family cysteine cluster protein [Candidatus Methanoperedens sp.]|nr:YkgJ family cysteine cluster protein [Candidatus Methanoperedens sp.]MCE8427445.1 YkgJ family cysteine cluster protein [Candidatus Methanoperedens sp.]